MATSKTGLAWRTVERAKRALGLVTEREGVKADLRYFWKLPDPTPATGPKGGEHGEHGEHKEEAMPATLGEHKEEAMPANPPGEHKNPHLSRENIEEEPYARQPKIVGEHKPQLSASREEPPSGQVASIDPNLPSQKVTDPDPPPNRCDSCRRRLPWLTHRGDNWLCGSCLRIREKAAQRRRRTTPGAEVLTSRTAMATIRTRYVPATDTLGTRIRVHGPDGYMTLPFDYAALDPHLEAATRYALRMRRRGHTVTRDPEAIRSTGTGIVYEV